MAWRYDQDFENLKDQLKAVDKTIEVEGKKTFLSMIMGIFTGTGKFEVQYTKDNNPPVLLYSGLANGRISNQDI